MTARLTSPHTYNRQDGFSLIEMSIIITAFAVLITGLLGERHTLQQASEIEITKERLDVLQKALELYVAAKGHYPCPARLTTSIKSTTFANSTNCSNSTAPTGTFHSDNGSGTLDNYQIRIGMVPTRALGLSDSYALDGWGHRIRYSVIRQLGDATLAPSFNLPTPQTSGFVRIRDISGSMIFGSNTSEIVGFTLISHGEDGQGAYDRLGNLIATCPTGLRESENCDDDSTFRQADVHDITTGGDYYHDYVRFSPHP